MRVAKDLDDVNTILREILNWKSTLETKALDLTGRQIKNGGAATDASDFVILSQIGSNTKQIVEQFITQSSGGGSTIITPDGFKSLSITSNEVIPDLMEAINFKFVINQVTQVTVKNPVFTGGTILAGQKMNFYPEQDAAGFRQNLAWDTKYGSDVSGLNIDGQPQTRSVILLKFHLDNLWHLDGFLTGLPIS